MLPFSCSIVDAALFSTNTKSPSSTFTYNASIPDASVATTVTSLGFVLYNVKPVTVTTGLISSAFCPATSTPTVASTLFESC